MPFFGDSSHGGRGARGTMSQFCPSLTFYPPKTREEERFKNATVTLVGLGFSIVIVVVLLRVDFEIQPVLNYYLESVFEHFI